MKKVLTNDGSYTCYSEEYDETYHSISGAMEEAFEKYVKPCKVKDGMRILDVCFGLGLNSLAALHTANVEIVGLEKDPEILAEEIEIPEEYKEDYKKLEKIKIIVGDARETIEKVEGKFDVVFFDPFSPPKCPELWTEEFFRQVKSKMKKNGVLATYSCARKVRDNLIKAGFRIEDGPKVGRRSPSTLAYLA